MNTKLKQVNDWNMETLSNYVSELIQEESGNVLGSKQHNMVLNRLTKRLKNLNISDPNVYADYLKENLHKEIESLTSLLTTHYTYFFREMVHFDYILNQLPQIVESVRNRGERKIKIYCGASSRGQEVYSLALFLDYHLKFYPGIDFEILGSDIDKECVDYAREGLYPIEEIKTIPNLYIGKHVQIGKGDMAHLGRIKNSIKDKCKLKVINLLLPENDLMGYKFDLIVCRNVFIYFDLETVKRTVQKLRNYLYDTSYFITGVSESLIGVVEDINAHAASVYSFGTKNDEVEVQNKKIRVLNVDDSPSVLKLLKKIFEDNERIEIVGQVGNGVEAADFLKNNKVDFMTLDIHMPVQNGVEYLEHNFHSDHPPVIIVSSAKREDQRFAQKALELGAADFVEKPSISNLAKMKEELTNKVISLVSGKEITLTEGNIFKAPESIESLSLPSLILFLGENKDYEKFEKYLSDLSMKSVPVVFLNYSTEKINEQFTKKWTLLSNTSILSSNIYVGELAENQNWIQETYEDHRVSICLYGKGPRIKKSFYQSFSDLQLLVEEGQGAPEEVLNMASDVFPATSFEYVSTYFLKHGESDDN